MKKSTKMIIAVIAIIATIIAVVVITNKNKHKLEEYIKPEYNYFAMYSTERKSWSYR